MADKTEGNENIVKDKEEVNVYVNLVQYSIYSVDL